MPKGIYIFFGPIGEIRDDQIPTAWPTSPRRRRRRKASLFDLQVVNSWALLKRVSIHTLYTITHTHTHPTCLVCVFTHTIYHSRTVWVRFSHDCITLIFKLDKHRTETGRSHSLIFVFWQKRNWKLRRLDEMRVHLCLFPTRLSDTELHSR